MSRAVTLLTLLCPIIVFTPTQAVSQEAKPFRITVVGAELKRVKASGQAWDDQNSLPDPFILLEGPGKQRLGTPWLQDEIYPNWGTSKVMHLREGDEIRMVVLDFDGPPDHAAEIIGRHRFVFDGKPGLKLFHFGGVTGIGLRFEPAERGGEGWGGAPTASKVDSSETPGPLRFPKNLARICVDSAIIHLGKLDGKKWDGFGRVSGSQMDSFQKKALAGLLATATGLDPTGITLALQGLGIANGSFAAPDPYAKLYINSNLKISTQIVWDSYIASWNEENCAQSIILPNDSIKVVVIDKDDQLDDPIGTFSLKGIPRELAKKNILVLSQESQAMAGQVLALQVSLQRPRLRYAFGLWFEEATNRNFSEVVRVAPDSSAQRSGLQRGDKLLAIDQTTTRGMTSEQVREAVARKPEITLTVLRPGKGLFDIQMKAGVMSAE